MTSELTLVLDRLQKARCPEDVFGDDPKTGFRTLLKIVHPDRNNNSEESKRAAALLNEMKTLADDRVEDGTWGKRLPLLAFQSVVVAGYVVTKTPVVGDLADVYLSTMDTSKPKTALDSGVKQDFVVKVARSVDDGDLMRAERRALELFAKKVTTPVRAGFPTLLGEARVGRREANVLEAATGFYTARYVHDAYPHGVPAASLVWIFKRLLSVLNWTHHLGLVHGAILPEHVLLYPDNDGDDGTGPDTKYVRAAGATLYAPGALGGGKTNPKLVHPLKHTVRLIDWCYCVEYAERTRLSAWVPAWESFYPKELVLKKEVTPASDIYMAAKLIEYLARGPLPETLQEVLNRCLRTEVTKRYQKSGEVFAEWVEAAERTFGKPKWVDFNVPR